MDFLNSLSSVVGQIVLVGGGGVAMGMGLFRYLGGKWIDARYEARAIDLKARHERDLAELKAAQERALADLKSEQTRNLSYVQLSIDREIHRAKQLFDREFVVLSEGWAQLVKCFRLALSTIGETYYVLDRYSDQELIRLIEGTDMKHWEIDELMAAEGKGRTEYYRRWSNFKHLRRCNEEQEELRIFLTKNGIFMRPEMKARFDALATMIDRCNLDFEERLKSPEHARQHFDEVRALSREGVPLRGELEKLIQERLWSASVHPVREQPAPEAAA